MKQIKIVGAGMLGETLTVQALRAISKSGVIIGSARLVKLFGGGKPAFCAYSPEKVAEIIRSRSENSFCILVSGDIGFYSAAASLNTRLQEYETQLIPGISSFSCFFSKLKLPYQDAKFVSLHGRDCNIADAVRRNRLVFALAGGNIPEIAERLEQTGFGSLKTYVGENLGAKNERVIISAVSEIPKLDVGKNAVMLIENLRYDDAIRFGIPDTEFIRKEKIPMTKSETRAVIISKLAIRPRNIVWDIGCGTGSVAVEAALAAYDGKVCAIDKNPEAITLSQENFRKFRVGNATAILGEVPSALAALPKPDAVFIGGTDGKIMPVIQTLQQKNPKARIVISAVSLESIAQIKEIFAAPGSNYSAVLLNTARYSSKGPYTMPKPQNPAVIICKEY